MLAPEVARERALRVRTEATGAGEPILGQALAELERCAGDRDSARAALVLSLRGMGIELAAGADFGGRYRIVRTLGRGGMGAVYLAIDLELDEPVALKLLQTPDDDATWLERFRREVRLARRVTHRNVARTYDFGRDGDVCFLTMEHVEGQTLSQLLATRGALPTRECAEIALATAEALCAAHEADVLHRDLKPANLMIETGGRVVVTDFGIARSLRDDDGLRTLGAIGTPTYMAPEQLLGGALAPATDLYALGLVLLSMATGRRPGDPAERLRRGVADPRATTAMPDALAELALRLTAIDPAARPTGDEVCRALRAFLEGEGADRPSPAHASVATQPATPIALLAPGTQTIAVLPFGYRGDADSEHLGEALCEELVDVLARTRGLKVLALGATRRFGADSDPRAAGLAAGADVIVSGTVSRRGSDVRITARLVDVGRGEQLWNERFDGSLRDALDLEESIARRIAESLRVELGTARARAPASEEAIDLYLRARRKLRARQVLGPTGALADLDAALELAPRFGPALASRALACAYGWFVADATDIDLDWQREVERSIGLAMVEARDAAETHFASGLYAAQRGEYGAAAQSITQALEIAPTYSEAHLYLGRLQCESGPSRVGIERIHLACELDPMLITALAEVARQHFLSGRMREFEEVQATLDARGVGRDTIVLQMRMRIAAWTGDLAGVRTTLEQFDEKARGPVMPLFETLGRYVLGELPDAVHEQRITERLAKNQNARRATFIAQLAAEGYACRQRYDDALRYVRVAVDRALTDRMWLEQCPALAPLREEPEFAALSRRTRARAAAMWNV